MTEAELRALAASTAESFIGLKEADDSHAAIIELYNSIRPLPRGYRMGLRDPWCAAFVSAVGQKCGLGAVILPECSCDAMIALYRARGRYEDASLCVPKLGDIVMYNFSRSSGAEHTGLITAVDGDTLRVVEGNSSDAVAARTINASTWYIYGFCLPDYASAAGTEEAAVRTEGERKTQTAPAEQSAEAREDCSLRLPELRRGDAGESVKAAQGILIARSFRCGPWGADGEFGAATYGAVQLFQRARGLERDGVIGPQTWRALLGVSA